MSTVANGPYIDYTSVRPKVGSVFVYLEETRGSDPGTECTYRVMGADTALDDRSHVHYFSIATYNRYMSAVRLPMISYLENGDIEILNGNGIGASWVRIPLASRTEWQFELDSVDADSKSERHVFDTVKGQFAEIGEFTLDGKVIRTISIEREYREIYTDQTTGTTSVYDGKCVLQYAPSLGFFTKVEYGKDATRIRLLRYELK